MNIPNLLKTDPEAFRKQMVVRGADATKVVHLYSLYKIADQALQAKLAERNAANHEVHLVLGTKLEGNITELKQRAVALRRESEELDAQFQATRDFLKKELDLLPNIPDPTVPKGQSENDNVVDMVFGIPRHFSFVPKEHDTLLADYMNRDAASMIAGARFSVLNGKLARLHRAIGQFMLDIHTQDNGFNEVNVPFLVNEQSVYNTGQLPKFKDDIFETKDGRFLIPTAEVSLTNIVAGQTIKALNDPIRMVALTPCFRKEAGSAGKDTRGLIRQHQFEKCELVTVCTPEQSEVEHRHMLQSAEKILQMLSLPYRRMLLCVGDMGFAAQKTYDLEVWMPGQNTYREISSVSNCGEFQARRMNTRFNNGTDKGFVHTLNGSGLAVGRTLAAIVENYQQADGTIEIPAALRPYMGGVDKI